MNLRKTAARPKHPVKEIEKLLVEAEGFGWRIEKPSAYYKGFCPCGKHRKTFHLTPSDPNYVKNARAFLKRTGCFGGGDK